MACQICNAGQCKRGDLHVRNPPWQDFGFYFRACRTLIGLLPGHMATAEKICRHLFVTCCDFVRSKFEVYVSVAIAVGVVVCQAPQPREHNVSIRGLNVKRPKDDSAAAKWYAQMTRIITGASRCCRHSKSGSFKVWGNGVILRGKGKLSGVSLLCSSGTQGSSKNLIRVA